MDTTWFQSSQQLSRRSNRLRPEPFCRIRLHPPSLAYKHSSYTHLHFRIAASADDADADNEPVRAQLHAGRRAGRHARRHGDHGAATASADPECGAVWADPGRLLFMINEISPEPGGLPFVYVLKTSLIIFPILLILQSFSELTKLIFKHD